MQQRTVVITGANTGIGLETAVSLAAGGDRVIIACRNDAKAAAAVEEIRSRSSSESVESVRLDLADFSAIRNCSARLAAITDRVDVLINNAGLIVSGRTTTVDGFETTFGVNHLGHFLFTHLLDDLIVSAPKPRIINVASAAHWFAVGGLNFEDLDATGFYNVWVAYGRSKLANIYFTQELARRRRADGVSVAAVHPGMVRSEFGADGDTIGITDRLLGFTRPLLISPMQGSETSVWLATSAAGADLSTSGTFWARRKPGILAPWARRPTDAARLWKVSERLCDLDSAS